MKDVKLAKLRRKDRLVADEKWISSYLHAAEHGVLSIASGSSPHAIPINFVFDSVERRLYFHNSKKGETNELVKNSPEAAFTVYDMMDLVDHEKATELSVNYRSVICKGKISIIEEIELKIKWLAALTEKYFSGRGKDIDERAANGPAIYCLDIREWSGKTNIIE